MRCPQKVQPLQNLALHPHQGGFDGVVVQPVFDLVGIILFGKRPDPYAIDRAAGLLTLGDFGLRAQQQQSGALLFGVFLGAVGTSLNEVVERI